MNFKNWLYIAEMAHVGMKQQIRIPCAKFTGQFPCIEEPIAMLDMRFEDPDAYPAPYKKLGNFSKFCALIPGTHNYLVYHGGGWADVVPTQEAIEKGFLSPTEMISEKGYVSVPNSWYLHAQLVGIDGKIVKPALGDMPTADHPHGTRQAFLDGKYAKTSN